MPQWAWSGKWRMEHCDEFRRLFIRPVSLAIATALLLGIDAATGGLQHQNTTANTF